MSSVLVITNNSAGGKTREIIGWDSLTRVEFAAAFMQQLGVMVNHRYRVDWQEQFSRVLYGSNRRGHTKLSMDFGMSFEMFNAQELKQEFFQHETISIHSCATYSEWPTSTRLDPKLHAPVRLDALFGLSDDPKHDPAYVALHMDHMIKVLDEQRHSDGRVQMDWLSVMSDGGPGHYKQRHNFFESSKIPWKHKRSDCQALVVDWSFFAEHHGKCILDAFTAVLKRSWRTHIMNTKVEVATPDTLLIQDAASATKHSRQHLFRVEKDDPLVPNKRRKGCAHAVEQVDWVDLTEEALNERRQRMADDVSRINGTLSNYHYRFESEGKVWMRWLSCPCVACLNQQWENCHNTSWVGQWELQVQTQLDRRGVAAHSAARKQWSDELANDLSVGDVVALFTREDENALYWLARVEESPLGEIAPTLKEKITCPVSQEEFEVGERVIWITYYDRIGRAPTLMFKHCSNLGAFIAPVTMLRKHNVDLVEHQPRHLRHRAIAMEDRRYYLGETEHQSILDVITNKFRDQ
jgi:hypothetical protein